VHYKEGFGAEKGDFTFERETLIWGGGAPLQGGGIKRVDLSRNFPQRRRFMILKPVGEKKTRQARTSFFKKRIVSVKKERKRENYYHPQKRTSSGKKR